MSQHFPSIDSGTQTMISHMLAQGHGRRRILLFSHLVPIRNPDNAGQRLVAEQALHWLEQDMDVTTLTVESDTNRVDAASSITPCGFLRAPDKSLLTRISAFVAHRITSKLPGTPVPTIAHAVWTDPFARELIRSADTIVLHWQREAALAPVFRRINPRAQLVAVMHDVDSQRGLRKLEVATELRERLVAKAQLAASRLAERLIVTFSDIVIVLSEKDAKLLPSRGKARVEIVPPPMPVPQLFSRHPCRGRILFVGAPRPENEEALKWLLETVRLTSLKSMGATLRVVGKQNKAFVEVLEQAGVDCAGFVPDLDGEYARAAIAVVPLQSGAGVKFKTLEAILRKVPIVTTTVGAEGIVGLQGSGDVTDSPESFRQRLESFLSSPDLAASNAEAVFDRVVQAHGFPAFQEAMERVLR